MIKRLELILKKHPLLITWISAIWNISLASALGSMLSLERTMLGTFGAKEEVIINTWLEAGGGLLVFTILIILTHNMMKVAKEK